MSDISPVEPKWQDLHAIQNLKARYFRLLDSQEWDEMTKVFTEDCHFDYTGSHPTKPNVGFIAKGGDDYVTRVGTRMKEDHGTTFHLGFMLEVDFTSHETAEGVCRVVDTIRYPPESEFPSFLGTGLYFEKYVKVGDEWKISSVIFKRLTLRYGDVDLNPDM
ncbi:nuclear transport factor 2 family protein [Rhodococcoides fascians]|uniref:nuclear transport factor 2 family protein n=1 Tax=Rhodococcoides fascians TaxID=1828 RepID=UPI0018AF5961|nr:nuclear transport factor 2 family protein [Rhodococcus fascians]